MPWYRDGSLLWLEKKRGEKKGFALLFFRWKHCAEIFTLLDLWKHSAWDNFKESLTHTDPFSRSSNPDTENHPLDYATIWVTLLSNDLIPLSFSFIPLSDNNFLCSIFFFILLLPFHPLPFTLLSFGENKWNVFMRIKQSIPFFSRKQLFVWRIHLSRLSESETRGIIKTSQKSSSK